MSKLDFVAALDIFEAVASSLCVTGAALWSFLSKFRGRRSALVPKNGRVDRLAE